MAIQDFGEKIGGARKDLWRSRGLRIEDIEDFNLAERAKYITKNNIWPKPDYEKMINEEGYSREALYFIKTVRDSIPTSPSLQHMDSEEEIMLKQEVYIDFLTDFKEELLNVKTAADIDKIGINYLVDHDYVYKDYRSYKMTNRGEVFINNKFFKSLQMSSSQAEREAQRKQFLADNIEVIRNSYKILPMDYRFELREDVGRDRMMILQHRGGSTTFYYPDGEDENRMLQLIKEKNLSLTGWNLVVRNNQIKLIVDDVETAKNFINDVVDAIAKAKEEAATKSKTETKSDPNRKKGLVPPILAHIERKGPEMRNGDVTGQDFLDTFKIKGGEFGNWLNEAEKQTNMNMAFDSFKDIARALNIKDEDISLGGKLSMAFGSRGIRGAAAHYEPMREVINLTKMKGAGSLAHEFFHSMDDISGKELGFGSFATEHRRKESAFADLVKAMRYKEIEVSPEEQNAELDLRCAKNVDQLKSELIKMVPDKNLTPELIEQRDKLIADLIEKAKDPDFNFREMQTTKRGAIKYIINKDSIKDMCDFIDANAKFYKMTDHNQTWLCQKLEMVKSAYVLARNDRANEPEKRTVETDFYKNAKALDGAYSKTTHGYYASEIEMAARAFACYLHDKMEAMGIKNDYLTGHAFQAGMGPDSKIIPTYPQKDEREFINKAFDKVIDQMKELGIFNERGENVLAAEAPDKFIVARNEPNRVAVTIYDKDYVEIGTASMLPGVSLEKALAAAALGKEIQTMDYSVFEAKKTQREAEIAEAEKQRAREESMGFPAIEEGSYKQLSFEDVINQAKETKAAQRVAASTDIQAPVTHQQKQFDIIQQANPMTDDYHVGIRSVEDIKTFEEAARDSESFCYGDFEREDAEIALTTGQIIIYSSKPFEQGGFVSTSYNMAKDYAGSGRVYSRIAQLEDVAWINGDEGVYAKVSEREKEQSRENSRSERKSDRDER